MKSRPAETAGAIAGTGAIGAAIVAGNWLAVGVGAIGYVPAVVTFLVTHGGIRGVLKTIWGGSK